MPKITRPSALAGTALLLVIACLAPAHAEDACLEPVKAYARAANPLNYDPPKHYNPERLAKDRAIARWRDEVASKCPRASNLWWRARDRKVECEGYAGGIGCDVSAIPAIRSTR